MKNHNLNIEQSFDELSSGDAAHSEKDNTNFAPTTDAELGEIHTKIDLTSKPICSVPLVDKHPAQRIFKIGQVCTSLKIRPHILRHWEKIVPQLAHTERIGNSRFYSREQTILLYEIKHLIENKRFTALGAGHYLANIKKFSSKQQKTSQKQVIKTIRAKLIKALAIASNS